MVDGLDAPQALTAALKSLDLAPWSFLMAINIVLLIVGCFLDPTSAILVLTPLFMPLVKSVGIDPIHFGIVMTANIAIGMFTPPFGLNLFVAQSVLKGLLTLRFIARPAATRSS